MNRSRTNRYDRRAGVIDRACSTHEVAGVAAGILLEVVLVIFLGTVPRAGWLDGGGDRTRPLARRADARDDPLGRGLLLRGLRKDGRPVLRAHVVALAVERGRIVQPEEPVL